MQTGDSGTTVSGTNPATMKMSNTQLPQPWNGVVGAWFQESPVVPPENPGKFIWVQILNSVNYVLIFQPIAGYTPPTNALNQLDGIYPYPSSADIAASQLPPVVASSNLAWDAPSRALYSWLGEAAEYFDATMYVLWDPALPAGCTPATVNTRQDPYVSSPSNCTSIPIPLGAIKWTWSACAINELAPPAPGNTTPQPSWFRHCGAATKATYQNSEYPQWSGCYVSSHGACY